MNKIIIWWFYGVGIVALLFLMGIGIKSCVSADMKNMKKRSEYRQQLFEKGLLCLVNPWSDSHEFERVGDKMFCKRCGLVKKL